ncbi:MAG: hypothetical protein R3F37_14565 [Candidatus Competibacteraceae bacterium]
MVQRDQALGVFIMENGRARFVLAPGAQEGRPFVMTLSAQTLVVTRGQQGLNDGQPVAVAGAR